MSHAWGEDHHHHVEAAGRLFRVRIWLSSAMWVPVLAANLIAVALAIGLPILDTHLGDQRSLPITNAAVQSIFGALAGGMITFTGIVFSAVFVAAQIQTSSYSPRLAARLRRDPVIIAGLALPTATATYALFGLAAIGRQADKFGHDFVPAATVLFGLVLAFVTLATFVALVQRTFEHTQIGGILRTIMRRAYAVIEEVHPHQEAATRQAPEWDGARRTEVAWQGRPAVIAAVDRAALLRVAEQSGGFVDVIPLVGEYLAPGSNVLSIAGARTDPDPELTRRVFVTARQRTIDQDPAFALRMLVDIAIRALSSAINDPTTAVQSIDRIEGLLVELAERHPGPALVVDDAGTPRARVRAASWATYVELGLTEIRRYGGNSPQVVRRMQALYEHLLAVVDENERPRVELEQRLLAEAVERAFPDLEERAIVSQPDRLGLGGT